MTDELKKRIQKDFRFQKIQQESEIDVNKEFKENFKDYEQIVDVASQMFLNDKNRAAAALMLPPIVNLVDEKVNERQELDLDPKHVLRNRALKDKNLDLYGQIDKYKKETAHMFVQLDQESEIDNDQDNEDSKKQNTSIISNEFWDEFRTTQNDMNRGDSISPIRNGGIDIDRQRIKPSQIERAEMMRQNFDDVIHEQREQRGQVFENNNRDLQQLRTEAGQQPLQNQRINSEQKRARTPGRLGFIPPQQDFPQNPGSSAITRAVSKDALIKQYNLYTEDDIENMKQEHLKQVRLVKKAAEVQMRNIKMLAKDKARLMLEKTVKRINDQVSLTQKIETYIERRAKDPNSHQESWIVQKNCPPYLSKPFNFYGGYVSLNLKEKTTLGESELVIYYKQTLIELEEKNRVLESEVSLLKELNMQYYQESNEKDEKIANYNKQIKDQSEDKEALISKYELRIKQMFEDFFQEKQKMEDETSKEKNMLQEELRVNDIIKDQLAQGQDKLRQELKELKRIIKIPRMHFKYLEKLEYDEILTQVKEIEEKQGTQTGTNLMSTRKKILKKHIRNLSMNSKDQQYTNPGADSVTSFFTTPISNQITKKHQNGLNAIIIPSTQFQSNEQMLIAHNKNQNSGNYTVLGDAATKHQHYTQLTLNKRDSLSSRSDLRKKATDGIAMSHTSVGFHHFNNVLGMRNNANENNSTIQSKENKLKQRQGNMTSLSPRSQTAILLKPGSNPHILTPSTQRVTINGTPGVMTQEFQNMGTATQQIYNPTLIQGLSNTQSFRQQHSFNQESNNNEYNLVSSNINSPSIGQPSTIMQKNQSQQKQPNLMFQHQQSTTFRNTQRHSLSNQSQHSAKINQNYISNHLLLNNQSNLTQTQNNNGNNLQNKYRQLQQINSSNTDMLIGNQQMQPSSTKNYDQITFVKKPRKNTPTNIMIQ
eukprot:403339870